MEMTGSYCPVMSQQSWCCRGTCRGGTHGSRVGAASRVKQSHSWLSRVGLCRCALLSPQPPSRLTMRFLELSLPFSSCDCMTASTRHKVCPTKHSVLSNSLPSLAFGFYTVYSFHALSFIYCASFWFKVSCVHLKHLWWKIHYHSINIINSEM